MSKQEVISYFAMFKNLLTLEVSCFVFSYNTTYYPSLVLIKNYTEFILLCSLLFLNTHLNTFYDPCGKAFKVFTALKNAFQNIKLKQAYDFYTFIELAH